MNHALSKVTRSDSRRTEDVSKLILNVLDMTRSAAEQSNNSTMASVSFTTLVQSVRDSKFYPAEVPVKSNLLAYHLKKMVEKGWIRQVKPEKLPTPEEGGMKQYSFYAITDNGRDALANMPYMNLKEIITKIDNWKWGMIGRLLHVEEGASEIANTLEKLSICVKNLFVTEQNTEDAAIELWTALEKLRTGTQLESTARFDHYFEVLSEELDQIGQEKEEDGRPEFAEEIILILKQFVEEQGENFRSYLQELNLQPVLAEMGEMLRRMLISLRSAQAKRPAEKEPKKSFFRRTRDEEVPGFQEKQVGDTFANIYEDIRLIVKPTNRTEELDLIQKIFFGMVEAMNYAPKTLNPPDKSVLMGKYMPLLGSLVGASPENLDS